MTSATSTLTKNPFVLFFSGLCIGVANLFPCISGATVALLFGIYEPMIEAIRSVGSQASWRLLLPVGTGVLVGILLLVKLLALALLQPEIARLFLCVVVCLLLWTSFTCLQKAHSRSLPFFALGFLISLPMTFWQTPSMHVSLEPRIVSPYLILLGCLSVFAMLLPGLSGGTVLLMGGVYVDVLLSLSRLIDRFLTLTIPRNELLLLTNLFVGITMGAVFGSRLISHLLKVHANKTYTVLSGLVAGSILPLLRTTAFF